MSTKSSPRTTRKRLRQATLSSMVNGGGGGDSGGGGVGDAETRKSRKMGAGGGGTQPRGEWSEALQGLMRFEPRGWELGKRAPTAPIKVAAFDLDSTLITTKTRAKFPKTAHDWKFLPRVQGKLVALAESGYVVAVFTNQAGVSNGRINQAFVRARLDGITAAIGADVGVFVATSKDNHRKPATGMWGVFVELMGGLDRIDMGNSFYVGDAAGRPARSGSAADFSDSDLRFSINIGLRFHTPEEYFNGMKYEAVSPNSVKGFDPRPIVHAHPDVPLITENTNLNDILRGILSPPEMIADFNMGASSAESLPPVQTMVLMHGFPASGKTSFVKRHLLPRGYVWINQDTMQTFSRCSRAMREALMRGRSVVVDNTNPDRSARAKYIELARMHDPNMKIIAVKMLTPKDLAQHLNVVRERESMGNIPHIPFVAYHAYAKRAQEPSHEEGIDVVAEVKFLPCFASEHEKYMFTRLT